MSLSRLYQSGTVSITASPLAESLTPPVPRGLFQRLLRLPAWLLPLGLCASFGVVFAVVYRDQLLPAPEVRVSRAVLLADLDPGSVGTAPASPATVSAKMLFQAGGWVEPDPLPIHAVALTDGVIEKVHVLEGQEVRKGQIIAELIAEDAQLALRAVTQSLAEASAATQLQAVQIRVAEAEAKVMLDQVAVTEARLAEERDNLARLDKIPAGSVSDQERTRARFVVQGQLAEVTARQSQQQAAAAKVEAARAQLRVLEAAVQTAQVMVEKQQLALSRTRIPSPVEGVVLALKAAPGQKKLLSMDDHESAIVATLYEKGHLQVRVDVPLSEARGLVVGQSAVITTDFLPQVEFKGEVTRIVGAADLQRNTLQAKVRVQDPDARLRPEMLCRVKFLEPHLTTTATDAAAPGQASPGSRVIMVPESAVVASSVWVIAADGVTARKRAVTTGPVHLQDHVSVTQGVLAGERVILPPHDQLQEGRRVRPEISTAH